MDQSFLFRMILMPQTEDISENLIFKFYHLKAIPKSMYKNKTMGTICELLIFKHLYSN